MSALINDHIKQFLEYLKFEKRYSLNTLTAYEIDLESLSKYLADEMGITESAAIGSSFIRSWLAGMKDQKASAKTINRKISSLKSFFKYLLRNGLILKSPMTQIISPKVGKRLPVFVKEDDILQLIQTLNASTEDWKSYNEKMLFTIFYATGMRLSELINLRESQIDFGRSQIKVLGKGNKERVIPVTSSVMKAIEEYVENKKRLFESPEDYLLVTEKGKKLYPRYAWERINRILGEATTLDKKSPHVLRHSFATHLMNNGADLNAVKELLGHSRLAATQVYTHNTIEKLKDLYKKAHPKA
jgi:integrase/recombinase XerC